MPTTEKRRADTARVRDRLESYLQRSGLKKRSLAVVPLTGDASDRRYFRVVVREAPSIVLALHPEPFSYETLPFVRIASLLRAMPVPVPAILDHADDLALLALQDLGDVTLQAHLGAVPNRPSTSGCTGRRWPSSRCCSAAAPSSPRRPTRRTSVAFDVEKLTWELEFFTKHFIEAYRGVAIDARRARRADARSGATSPAELAGEPRVLCHRDYHSRNLMLHDGRLYIIDFQDARMGPDTYDLVSLLRDSYVDLTEDAQSTSCIAHFIALGAQGRSATAPRTGSDVPASAST